MRNLKHILTLSLLFSALSAFATFRENILFTTRLDGAQVVPAISTNGIGIGSIMLHKKRDTLSINISTLGFVPTTAAIYVGGAGSNGTLLFNLNDAIFGNTVLKKVFGTEVKNNLGKLMSGQLYLVIGSAAHPDGEVRGQVRLVTDQHYSADLKGSEVVPAVTTNAYGLGSFGLSLDQQHLNVKIIAKNLSGSITGAKLHIGNAGTTGALAFDLGSMVTGNVVKGMLVPTADFLTNLASGKVYLNISTAAYPNGELRAQLQASQGFVMESFSTGAQMVPPVATDAAAIGVYRFSPGMDSLYYDIVMDNLATNVDYMHLHIGYEGETYTALQVDLTAAINGNRAKGVLRGSNLSATTISKLLISNLTLITHTVAYPGGEIRGHAQRFAHEGYTLQLSGAQQVPSVASSGYGSGYLSVGSNPDRAYYTWLAGNLSSTPTSATLNNASAGQNGAILHDMTSQLQVVGNAAWASGAWSTNDALPFSAANNTLLDQNKLYINLATANYPDGELRGQVRIGTVFYASTSDNDEAFGGQSFRIAPNPASATVRVQLNNTTARNFEVRLLDTWGKTLQNHHYDASGGMLDAQLDLGQQPAGVYLLFISDGKNTLTRKLVKV